MQLSSIQGAGFSTFQSQLPFNGSVQAPEVPKPATPAFYQKDDESEEIRLGLSLIQGNKRKWEPKNVKFSYKPEIPSSRDSYSDHDKEILLKILNENFKQTKSHSLTNAVLSEAKSLLKGRSKNAIRMTIGRCFVKVKNGFQFKGLCTEGDEPPLKKARVVSPSASAGDPTGDQVVDMLVMAALNVRKMRVSSTAIHSIAGAVAGAGAGSSSQTIERTVLQTPRVGAFQQAKAEASDLPDAAPDDLPDAAPF